MFIMISLLFGTLAVLTTVAIALLAAGIIGLVYWMRDRRNLMPAAMQAACYLAPFLTLWVMFAGLSAVMVTWINHERGFNGLAQLINIDRDLLTFLVWLFPNIILAVVFFNRVAAITSGARYANK
jgi:hypothetical protein